jgi:iron complex transport system substrate-binding protein
MIFDRTSSAVLLVQIGVVSLGLIAGARGQALQPANLTPPTQGGRASVADQHSHELTPRRVVTMQPSFTEIVCALGACDRLVATDRYSNWPAEVGALPKAGGLEDAQIEAIVSVKPDLVLLRRSGRLAERLTELKIPTVSLNPRTYADIARTVSLIGEMLGIPNQARALNASIEQEVNEVSRHRAARHGEGPTVYFEVDRGAAAAGAASFIGELLARLGARNIVTPELGPFPKLNPEYVVGHNPDVIFLSPVDAPQVASRPGWADLRAVKEQRLCSFPTEVRDLIARPGPRVAEGMRAMAECLDRVSP